MATNPCPCGYHGSKAKQCKCSPLQRESYVGKISGPLLDRIAIHVTVQPVDVEAWSGRGTGLSSGAMRDLVTRARGIQAKRFDNTKGIDCNARIPEGLFATLCPLEPNAERLFVHAQKKLLVSARARGHILRVARTIADLDAVDHITERHIMEAVGYRASGR